MAYSRSGLAFVIGLVCGIGIVGVVKLAQKPFRHWKSSRHLEIGRAHARSGNYVTAIQQLERAVASDPGNPVEPEARYQMASISLALNQPVEAIRQFRQVAEKFPDSPWAEDSQYMLYRIFDERLGRPDMAKAALKDYINKFPRGRYFTVCYQRLLDLDRTLTAGSRGRRR